MAIEVHAVSPQESIEHYIFFLNCKVLAIADAKIRFFSDFGLSNHPSHRSEATQILMIEREFA